MLRDTAVKQTQSLSADPSSREGEEVVWAGVPRPRRHNPGPQPSVFTVDNLIACYRRGVFPMAEARNDDAIYLVDPEERGVIPLDEFHAPRRLTRTVRAGKYEPRIDSAFTEVIELCARPAPGRTETWISGPIQRLYQQLFARGLAHSVECWLGDRLVGGLYGVSIGAAFFGESMFSLERDASKVALVHLVARLRAGGYKLLDAQFLTPHLAQFGAREIPRNAYRRQLALALAANADFYRLPAYTADEAVAEAVSAG
jgi:leucyl/phenylalanyl-tRNA--protein transferase